MPARKRTTGFTLVELYIVLVIIGLLVGGVLAGKTLIQQAEIRAAASQLQQMETAYRTFQTKYGCIMGDCSNATDFFGYNYMASPGSQSQF
ncbi:MAG: prepilin-type N-terminal cleavage/methylation domain-containing protein [Nitrospirota bacterium]